MRRLRPEAVRYVGPIPHERVPGLIAGSALGATPQNNAGGRAETGLSALKFYETLAFAVPIVASAAPGHREIVSTHDCGLLFPSAMRRPWPAPFAG